MKDFLDSMNEKLNQVLINQAVQTKINQDAIDTLKSHTEILTSHEKILTRNTAIVDEHQKRSLALEAELKRTQDEDINPLKAIMHKWEGAGNLFKWIGVVFSVLGGMLGVVQIVIKLLKV